MDPTDFLSVQAPTLTGVTTPSAPAFDLSPNELLARALEAYPSQIYQGWQPSPPSMEDAAKASPLMQLGLAHAYPDLFGYLGPSGLGSQPDGDAGQYGATSNGPALNNVATGNGSDSLQSDQNQAASSSPQQGLPPAPRAYVAKPGDSISTIVGSSDPTAIGQFAIRNGLQSSTIHPGQTYAVPDPSQTSTPQASMVGQAMLNTDNARLAAAAQQRREATAPASGIRINGKFYPADQMWAAAAALNDPGPPAPRDPDQDFFALQSALAEEERLSGQPKRPEGWFHKAQRNFWETVSDHTADNAGDFFGGGIKELWDDLPGLQPEFAALSTLGGIPQASEALVDAEAYEDLAPRLSGTGVQAHHLNQDAVYKEFIPRNEGLAVELPGDAITTPGTQHFIFHSSLENFWNRYRNGALDGQMPTNGQYGDALEQGLIDAGISPGQSASWARQAAKQRTDHGLLDTDPVPRIPGRLPQARSH